MRLCINCGYDLQALPEPRCPECGRGFDPDDPTTYRTSKARRPLSARRMLGAAACFLAGLLCMRLINFPGESIQPNSPRILGVLAAWGLAIAGILFLVWRRR
jgi:hypothetical protein